MAKFKLHQVIADKILESLEQGIRPWEQCYEVSKGGFPKSSRNIEYTGTNRLLFSIAQHMEGYTSNVWLTFNDIKKLGADIKGQKGTMGIFYKSYQKKNKTTGEDDTVKFIKHFNVYNTDQIKGLPDNYLDQFKVEAVKEYANTPIEKAEQFINNIPVKIETADTIPCYIVSKDLILMPDIKQFKTTEQYYATLLHELIHSTKHESRLNRKFDLKGKDERYALEEMTAELGSAFMMPSIGIEPLIDIEHAPYISHYIKLLKDHPKAFITACSKAEEASQFLLEFQKKSKP